MPAGFPCFVITISSFSARRRYFDKSSLISDRGICFIAFTVFFEPSDGLGFQHDRQDLDYFIGYVVKHSSVITHAKAVLGSGEASQALDAALAGFGRLMPQMLLDGITHRGANT